jgi:hypothetical protein
VLLVAAAGWPSRFGVSTSPFRFDPWQIAHRIASVVPLPTERVSGAPNDCEFITTSDVVKFGFAVFLRAGLN